MSAGGTINYVYDRDNAVEELDSAGAVIAKYAQGEGIDEPVAMLRGSATSYYEADGLGSITSLTDSTAAIASSYTYDPFGRLVNSTGTLANAIRYTAREFDTETGLYYYRARSYDVTVGRFTTEDPLRFQAAANFYAYVENNPANLTDPYGLVSMPKPICPQGEGNCGKKKCEGKSEDERTVKCMTQYFFERGVCWNVYKGGPGYSECIAAAKARLQMCLEGRPMPRPLIFPED